MPLLGHCAGYGPGHQRDRLVSRPVWRRSRFCNGASACAEVAVLPGGNVTVRNSAEQDGPVLVFTPEEWAAFRAGVRAGEFAPEALARSAGDGSGVDGPSAGCTAPLAGS